MRFWMYHGHPQEPHAGEGFDGPVLHGIAGVYATCGKGVLLLFNTPADYDEAVSLTGWDTPHPQFLELCFSESGLLKRWNQLLSRFEYYDKWEIH